MLELLINNFDKIIGSVLVAVFGGYVTYRIYKKTRFNQASAKFRSTVINELVGLYPIPIDWPGDIDSRLSTTFPKIQAAVEEFKPFISTRDIKAFNEAWLQYYTHCKHIIPNVFSLANRLYEAEKPQSARDDFRHNVDTLLSFAKEK